MKPTQIIEFKSAGISQKESAVTVEIFERTTPKTPFVEWTVNGKSFYRTDAFGEFENLKFLAKRTSIYKKNELALMSPEHLAPVFLMWPNYHFKVNVFGEVPLMDGSAIPFFTKLRKYCGSPEDLVFYEAPLKEDFELVNSEGVFGKVHIEPSETFEVEYELCKTLSEAGYDLKSSATVSIYSAENLYQIFMARTFIHEAEFLKAKEAGLLNGVNESCGLLLKNAEYDSVSKNFRVKSEPALHKILDLLGDLTLICPRLPKVRIEITNGGHVSHRQIMEKLIPYVYAGVFTQV